MKKVLQLFGEPLDNGGQEAFIMNIYRNIDRNKVQFDFFTPYNCANKNLKDEIISLGGNVYADNGRFDTQGNKIDFINKVKKFLKKNKYEIVHIHSGSVFSLAIGARIAKKSGAKKIIVHSHATGYDNIKHRIIKKIATPLFLSNVTDYCACSKIAAEWKFPTTIIKKKAYKIINNGIDLSKFYYDEDIRKEYRKELKIENKFVVCHVGRFTEEKNHEFLIYIFNEINKMKNDAELLLVGDGLNKENMENLVSKLGLNDKIKFLGKQKETSNILQAADVFVFPSKFEGLGIVAIEAQATGLPTICSENIPDEANVTELFYRMNIETGAKEWAKKILSIGNTYQRRSYEKELRKNGFDSKQSAQVLERIYMEES